MANFPTGFEAPHYIDPAEITARYAAPFIELDKLGYVVVAGLCPANVADLTEISEQAGTLEYCPNDIAKRWTDIPTAEKQLGKDGGRGAFRLEKIATSETAAHGWTGKSSADERAFLPDCENTFAVRVNERFQRQGLGKLFSHAIVAGSMGLYRAKRIGLETWASNTGAVKSYLGAKAVLSNLSGEVLRPTLDESFPIAEDGAHKGKHVRTDIRLYMKFPWSF